MTPDQLDFVFPVDQGFPELISSMQNAFPIRIQDETTSSRVFFDTFDWLLYNNGSAIEMHENGHTRRIYWRKNKDDELKIQLGLKQVPGLAHDLPDCELRKQLLSVISVRELTPRIKIKIKRTPVVVLDKNEKVVVRINLDENWYYPSKTRAGTLLGKRLTVKAVKGYPKAYQQIEAFIQKMELRPAQDNMMKLALAESGKSPSDYTTKLNLFLDPDMPAEQAIKDILLRLLEIMQQNTAGSIKGIDTEFMHDYRVSIRKTRSALTQIKHVLPKDVVKKYKDFFAGLGTLTTPVRDIDVFLLELEGYQRELKKSKQEQLAPLREYLIGKRAEAQKKFTEFITSSKYRSAISDWRKFLESPLKAEPVPDNSGKPVYQLANKLIWNMFELAIEEGNAITRDTKAEALHELRKTCKKLRYLMEFFQSLYPARQMRELIQALKGLQDNLGTFNDLHVHSLIMQEFIDQSSDKDAAKACKKLIKVLEQRQQKTRNGFDERYTAFSSPQNQNEFKELFVDSHNE